MKIGYHLALRWARWKRSTYQRQLPAVVRRAAPMAPDTDAAYYSFSGTRDLPEQVACLRTFLRQAAHPRKLVVVGDGTHTDADRSLLRALSPRLESLPWDAFIRKDLPPKLMAYAQAHPLGKKIAVLMSVQETGSWIFSDSDILYFSAAGDIRRRLSEPTGTADYLEDCYPSLDDRLVRGPEEKRAPVNSGFILVHRPLDWRLAMERFDAMQGESGYFTEQTLFHLAVQASGGKSLPMDRYVIQSDDQWVAADRHSGPGVVLRHYFSSIRYKMWLKVRARD